jgi:hypothetical protein
MDSLQLALMIAVGTAGGMLGMRLPRAVRRARRARVSGEFAARVRDRFSFLETSLGFQAVSVKSPHANAIEVIMRSSRYCVRVMREYDRVRVDVAPANEEDWVSVSDVLGYITGQTDAGDAAWGGDIAAGTGLTEAVNQCLERYARLMRPHARRIGEILSSQGWDEVRAALDKVGEQTAGECRPRLEE